MVSRRVLLLLSLFWAVLSERAGAAGHRNGTCITGVPTFASGHRRTITVGGITGPFKMGVGDWDSNLLLHYAVKIVIEEVVGVQTVVSPFTGSAAMVYAVAGCQDVENYVTDPQCGVPGDPLIHATLGCWMMSNVVAVLGDIRDRYPSLYPVELGSIGFPGRNGMWIKRDSMEPALRKHHLSLEYYMAYSHPLLNISDFFDSIQGIRSADLFPCSDSELGASSIAKNYLDATQDRAGVEITETPGGLSYSMNCSDGFWWLSPRCRADPSRCIPSLTAGRGWGLMPFLQRSHAWELPLAVAVAKDWATYLRIVNDHRVVFYWWFPDSAFLHIDPTRIVWPPHVEREWERNMVSTDDPETAIVKLAHHEMPDKASVGTERLLATLARVRFSRADITELMSAYVDRVPGEESLEAVACEWLNKSMDKWSQWIPVDTNCLEGQGLVSLSGDFVDVRVEATSCAWCTTGQISVGFEDYIGPTHRCKACDLGKFSATIGMTVCEDCAEGWAASREGMSGCDRCTFGEFASSTGSSQCEQCASGFITSFEGATSAEACLCGEGFYRDAIDRDTCKKCKFGMTCPVGSDALGFDSARASQHLTTPLLGPGYWSSADEPLLVFRCESNAKCPGNRVPGDACATLLEDRACSHCTAGYEWTGKECAVCITGALKLVLFPALPILIFPIVVGTLYWAAFDTYSEWGRWESGVGAMLFIILHYAHIINVIRGTNTAFSQDVQTTYEYFSFASDVWGIFQMGCYGFKTFTKKLILQSLGPIWLFMGYALTWAISQLIGRRYPAVRLDINRTWSCFLSIIFSFFTGIADMAFTVFKCGSNPNPKYSLVKDRSIICYQEEWNALSAIGIMAVLCWCGGVAMIFIWAIWTAPSRFHMPAVQARWRFLFVRYRPDVHWWSLVFLAKGILVNMCSVLFVTGITQNLWILAILLIYAGLSTTLRPWRHTLNNTVDLFTHFGLIMNCSIMFWYAKDPNMILVSEGNDIGNYCVQTVTWGVVSLILPFTFLLFWAPRRRAARRAVDLELIQDSIQILAVLENCDDFMTFLTERDFQLMLDVKDLVQTEIAGRKCRRGYSSHELRTLDMNNVREERTHREQSAIVAWATGSMRPSRRDSTRSTKCQKTGSEEQPARSISSDAGGPTATASCPAWHTGGGGDGISCGTLLENNALVSVEGHRVRRI